MSQFLLHRRQVMAAAVASLSMFDLPRLSASEDPFKGWPIGIQTFSLRGYNLLETIRHIQGMGLHFVEFYPDHVPQAIDVEGLRNLNQLLSKADIKMAAHGVWSFSSDHDFNKSIFDFAKRLGVRCLTANPAPDSFESLDKLVDEYKIRVAIHNHGPDALYDKISSVVDAVKDHHPLIGSCIDTGHFIRSKEDPVEAILKLNKRVFALHIKDEAKMEKVSHNTIIGEGHLDVVGVFQALKKVEFPADGSISLEYEANPQNPIDDIKQCIEVAKDAIAKIH